LGPGFEALREARSLEELTGLDADAYFDLLFEPDPARIGRLRLLLPRTVIINSVTETLASTDPNFIRLNAWPGFVDRPVAEIALAGLRKESEAGRLFASLNWDFSLVPDRPGMVSPRVISMIVNEAYYAWEDQVSSREEIDTAMRLGTGYPWGPFEWAGRIGLARIYGLLRVLQQTDGRYSISRALEQEAMLAGA
jgi:3-hydroxybutyryl-CoA dehydrogenase